MNKIKALIPFIILFALLGLLYRELFFSSQTNPPSALLGTNVPMFALQNIMNPQEPFSQKNLVGQVSLLNVWASWCPACSMEHEMLMKIKNDYRVPIYGIAYKDNPEAVKKLLQRLGNPFVMVGDDRRGEVAIDLGIYGTPETFVIDPQGKIIYKHIGIIDQQAWDDVLRPLLQKYGAAL